MGGEAGRRAGVESPRLLLPLPLPHLTLQPKGPCASPSAPLLCKASSVGPWQWREQAKNKQALPTGAAIRYTSADTTTSPAVMPERSIASSLVSRHAGWLTGWA